MELFHIGFVSISVIDLLDIAIVSYIFYRLYVAMRGTVAAQIFVGFIFLIALFFVAQALNLKALGWLLRTVTDVWVIALLILFQPEIRRLLILFSRGRLMRYFVKLDVTESIDEVVGAAVELSKKRHGALMVIVRSTGLRTFAESGIQLEARISKSLLISIFNPKSPLHDGAVIIKDRVVEAARCTLPFSTTTKLNDVPLGMRHRAGLGITEQADVVVVIISEETGTISVAENGVLERGFTGEALRQRLQRSLTTSTTRWSLRHVFSASQFNSSTR